MISIRIEYGTRQCSTPYGIKGIGTALPIEPPMGGGDKCSTPYGIKGIGTDRISSQLRHNNAGAQRLTASKELEPKSTPDNPTPGGKRVLNALRHQRNWNLIVASVS